MNASRKRWPRLTRDTALFVTGLLLIINESLIRSGPVRPELLILFGGMVGLPAFLKQDRAGPGQTAHDTEDEPTPRRPNDDLMFTALRRMPCIA